MKLSQKIIILLCAPLLSCCGFHLRGKINVSGYMHSLYLQTSSEFTPLSQALEKAFSSNGIELASSSNQAKLTLRVYNEQRQHMLMTIAASQQNRQYKLNYSLQYAIYNPAGHLILGPKTIVESRTQIIQANQLLDNNSETQQLYDSMRNQAIDELLYQLTSLNTHKTLNHYFMLQHENKA